MPVTNCRPEPPCVVTDIPKRAFVTCEKVLKYLVGFTTESLRYAQIPLLVAWWSSANLLVTVYSVVREGWERLHGQINNW